MAIGFTLIFGVLNVVNCAHGGVCTVGAFAGLLLITAFAPFLVVLFVECWRWARRSASAWSASPSKPFRRFSDEGPRAEVARHCADRR